MTLGTVIAAVVVLYAITWFVPRLGMYMFGPGVLIGLGVFFMRYKEAFWFFRSEGSAAGLFVPIIMWILMMAGVGIGFGLIGMGAQVVKHREQQRGGDSAE